MQTGKLDDSLRTMGIHAAKEHGNRVYVLYPYTSTFAELEIADVPHILAIANPDGEIDELTDHQRERIAKMIGERDATVTSKPYQVMAYVNGEPIAETLSNDDVKAIIKLDGWIARKVGNSEYFVNERTSAAELRWRKANRIELLEVK